MIKCPRTVKSVYTGYELNRGTFEKISIHQRTLRNCPACGRSHTWSKEEAWLQGDPPKS